MTTPPAAPTALDLITYVNGTPAADTEYAQAKLDEARILVDRYVGTSAVPVTILHQAYLEVGSALWVRRNAPGGSSYDAADSPAIQVHSDPLAAVYPELDRWTRPGLA